MVIDKVCRDCRLAKPLDEFVRNASGTFGRGSYCRPCQKIRRKRHYDLNRDRAVEMARRQREQLKAEPPHFEFPPDMTKSCRGCGRVKPLNAFAPHDRGLYGRYSLCRPCAAERAHAWREKDVERARELHRAAERARYERDPETFHAASRRWTLRYPERRRLVANACAAVLKAIKLGELVRPTACEQCGSTGVKIDAAHSDYTRPLDVRWLCRRCHVMWDIAEPKTKTA